MNLGISLVGVWLLALTTVKPHLKRHERSAGNSSFYSDGVWYHCAPPFKPHFYTCIHIVKKVHLPFFEANQFCKYLPSSEEYKSGLLKVENPEQIKLLTNHLKKNYGDCGEVKGHKIDGEESEISDPWIGVCYTYDDFRWNSNDQLVHTFNWVGNHSTIQSGGVALNCEEKFEWNLEDTTVSHPFICEVEPVPDDPW